MTTLEMQISEHVARCRYEDLPAAAVQAAKYSILDTIGVMLAATSNPDCQGIAELAREFGGKAESTVFGFGDRLPAPLAAMVNGALCHPLDFDDTHDGAKCHPAAESFPAAFALAQRLGNVSGKDLITAMAVGGDVACRIALSVDLGPASHGWLGSCIYSHFGATAAAGKILGLSAEQMSQAFGIAFCQTAGSHEMSEDCSYRGVRDGFAQKVGVTAALLAQKGLTGPTAFLEGKAGLYNQYFKGMYTPEHLTKDLGNIFEGANVSYKLWPSCRLTHNYIQSLMELLDENDRDDDEIEEVSIVVSDWGKALCEPADLRERPTTPMGAKVSLPFILGAVLAHRNVKMDHFSPEGLVDPAILAEAQKITYRHEPTLSAAAMSPGDVRVKTRQGKEYHKVVEFLYGSPRNPIKLDDLKGKFLDCVTASAFPVDEKKSVQLFQNIANLENLHSVEPIVA